MRLWPPECRWHGCCYRNFSQTKGESTCISTGIYGYPIEDAAKIAVREAGDYLTQSCREAEVSDEMEVSFCCFSERDNQIYEQVLENLK